MPRRPASFALLVPVVLLASLALRSGVAHAEVQASGNTSAPWKGLCAHGAVTMTQVGDHLALMAYAATWGSVGTAICNTWSSGPDRQVSVSVTVHYKLLGEAQVCGGNPAYPGWQSAVTDVLDLVDPATGSRTITHPGCGPGFYQVSVRASFKDSQGVWHGGNVYSPWELYLLPWHP